MFPVVIRLSFCDSSARPTTDFGDLVEVCSTTYVVEIECYRTRSCINGRLMIEGNSTNRL